MGYKKKWYDNDLWLRFEYVRQGLSIEEIAKKAGVSEETVRKLLLKYEITRKR